MPKISFTLPPASLSPSGQGRLKTKDKKKKSKNRPYLEIMARPFSKRIKAIQYLNKIAIAMIYLMMFAILFKIKMLLLISFMICGLCQWLACFLSLFREKYSQRKTALEYQELEKLPHRRN